jgi:two-component system phosphate regulon response regulator OmpR
MPETVLIIDDDIRLAGMLRDYLSRAGFTVDARQSGRAGLEAAMGSGPGGRTYDAIVLDIMLPDLDGLEVCRRLRDHTDVPILMLTARGEDADRIVGLELGADDYLPKPFNPRELQARLKAILRRRRDPGGGLGGALRFGRLEIDSGARSVRIDGKPRALTSYQFDLLLAFARHAGRVLSREQLMDLTRGALGRSSSAATDHHRPRRRLRVRPRPGPGLRWRARRGR